MNISMRIKKQLSSFFISIEGKHAAISFLLIGILSGFIGYTFLFGSLQENFHNLISEFYSNFAVEFISIGLTVLIIDRLNHREYERQSKKTLILQMGSPDHGFAIEAARVLDARGWLSDGSLKRAYLRGANLQNVNLSGAKLQQVTFDEANFTEATIIAGDLEQAFLEHTIFTKATLLLCNFANTSLKKADLRGATLRGSNFLNANLIGAKFDKHTILPDGSKWLPSTDMARFTDFNHPEFQDTFQSILEFGRYINNFDNWEKIRVGWDKEL